MKVKNSGCINKLARKTLAKSEKRNVIAVIAIALTTLLFTGILSVMFNIKSTLQEFNERMVGSRADGYCAYLTDKDYEKIASDKRVSKVGYELKVGTAMEEVAGNKSIEIEYMDENSVDMYFTKPMKGEMPKQGNEILVDTGLLTALELPCEIGVEVTFPFIPLKEEEEMIQDTFTVVGIYEENVLGKVHYVITSKEYATSKGAVTVQNVKMKKSAGGAEAFAELVDEIYQDRLTEYGDQKQAAFFYDEYYTSSSDYNAEDLFILGVFILVMGLSGYLIIYNIFQISVVNDISYYGLLKTIGVTGRQLRAIIRKQALTLSAIGIPIGLILGYFVGILTSPKIMKMTLMSQIETVNSGSVWIFVLASMFSLVTVFVSCNKPGKTVAKISPIEAFRYSEGKLDNKSHKKVSGISGMAGRNLLRNKKKTVLVVLSMALPVVVFSLGMSLGNSFHFEQYYTSDYAFFVSNSDYFHYEIPTAEYGFVNDFVSDENIGDIREKVSFETWGSAYMPNAFARCNEEIAMEVGFDETMLQSVIVESGNLEPLFDPTQNAIALSTDAMSGRMLAVGDKVTLNYGVVTVNDTRTGEVIEDQKQIQNTPEIYRDYDLNYIDKEYEICAIVSYPYEIGPRYYLTGSYEFVINADRLKADTEGRCYRYLSVFDTKDTDKLEAAEEVIKDYTKKEGLYYSSQATERAELAEFVDIIKMVTFVISLVLLFIGTLNFINAVLTGILTRSHELAMMKAIGMTDSQQKKMLMVEGLFYAGNSILVGCGIYFVLQLLLEKLFEDMNFIQPRLSFMPLLGFSIIFAVLGLVIPGVIYRYASKKTVVERLRGVE